MEVAMLRIIVTITIAAIAIITMATLTIMEANKIIAKMETKTIVIQEETQITIMGLSTSHQQIPQPLFLLLTIRLT